MKIQLPKTYSQNDPLWKNKILGTAGTIGQYGCLIACAAMMSTYFGHEETPDSLNEFLKNHAGYSQGNLYVWTAITNRYADIVFQGLIKTPDALTKAQMDAIRMIIDQKYPVFLKIDVVPTTSKLDEHWVLAVDYDGDDFIIQDPWDGSQKRITSWGVQPQKLIYGYGYYSGSPISSARESVVNTEVYETLSVKANNWDKLIRKVGLEESEAQSGDKLLAKIDEYEIEKALWKNEKENYLAELTKLRLQPVNNPEPATETVNNPSLVDASSKAFWQSKKVIISLASNLLSFGLILFQTAQVKPGDDWQTASVKLLGAALAAFGISNVASQYVKAQGLIDTTAMEKKEG